MEEKWKALCKASALFRITVYSMAYSAIVAVSVAVGDRKEILSAPAAYASRVAISVCAVFWLTFLHSASLHWIPKILKAASSRRSDAEEKGDIEDPEIPALSSSALPVPTRQDRREALFYVAGWWPVLAPFGLVAFGREGNWNGTGLRSPKLVENEVARAEIATC